MRIEVRLHAAVSKDQRPWTARLIGDVPLVATGKSLEVAVGRLFLIANREGIAGADLDELPPYRPPPPPPPPKPPEPLNYVI